MILSIVLMKWPIEVISNSQDVSSAKLIVAYVIVVLLPLRSVYALYCIIKSKSYQEVFPFKSFLN